MTKRVLLLWPPAASMQGPPLGLAAIAGYLRAKRPDVSIQALDLNAAAHRECLTNVPRTSDLAQTVRGKWSQSEAIQDAISRWAFGVKAPPGVAELPAWEAHYLSLLIGRALDRELGLVRSSPVAIGMSICDNGLIAAIGITEKLRLRFPESVIVWGGVSMSERQAPAVLARIKSVDAIVVGEGEEAFVSIVDAAPDLSALRDSQILTRHSEQPAAAPRRHYMPAEPAFDIFDLSLYPAVELPMTIARGCGWGRCVFCNENYAASSFQPINPERSARWALAWQQRYRPVSFELVDSAANSNEAQFVSFCKTLLAGGGLREWRCMMRSSDVSSEVLAIAAQSGLASVYFGIESLSDRVLKYMNKGLLVAHHVRAIRIALELGLRVEGDLILFHPGDSPEAVAHAISLIRKYDHLFQHVSFSCSRFVPGLSSGVGEDPGAHGIVVLNASLRLARHLPHHLASAFVPWDPYWRYAENRSDDTIRLAKSYCELQAELSDVVSRPHLRRVWYEQAGQIVLEQIAKEGNILDRLYLAGKQREIWQLCEKPVSAGAITQRTGVSQEHVEEFMNEIVEAGFMCGDKAGWTWAALRRAGPTYAM